jgi:hypothetical protein
MDRMLAVMSLNSPDLDPAGSDMREPVARRVERGVGFVLRRLQRAPRGIGRAKDDGAPGAARALGSLAAHLHRRLSGEQLKHDISFREMA